ncbi:class I SAM-dependent methyltransferase [Methylorubrum extorquens]|uniref:class I SAM-dependent methyltransferase n=1 Tax=Methylorubrum extorquens TaxID=408 RepID=UPI0020A0F83D|nr:cyclopropane fatty-acyl-phospholipid synthase-like methyltransferase [Methylorubrum extorquens]
MARIPAYFDAFLAAVAEGAAIDHVHLGHWDEPRAVGPARARAGFAQAQERLSAALVAWLDLAPGHRVLDVGCGFGGTLRAIRRSDPEVEVIGLNLDPRQLAVGLRQDNRPRNAAWVAGDACRLPFAEAAFDRLLCVEAAFHFASRRAFFGEAQRVLTREGVLVMSDIVLTRPPLPPERVALFADGLEAAFGPWPDKWAGLDAIRRDAEAAGFTLRVTDATANTEPSYHTIASDRRGQPTGGDVLRELHRLGCLHYLYCRLDKR